MYLQFIWILLKDLFIKFAMQCIPDSAKGEGENTHPRNHWPSSQVKHYFDSTNFPLAIVSVAYENYIYVNYI